MRSRIAGTVLCLILLLAVITMLRGSGSDRLPEPEKAQQFPARIVYTTPKGGKYHRRDCSSLAKAKTVNIYTSAEEAEQNGFEACSRCKPREGTE